MAANTVANANSWLRDHAADDGLAAATVALVAVRSGAQRTSQWHKVIVGAWHGAGGAESALAGLRRHETVAGNGGVVVRVRYAVLLADSASRERARAVTDVGRAKGLTLRGSPWRRWHTMQAGQRSWHYEPGDQTRCG